MQQPRNDQIDSQASSRTEPVLCMCVPMFVLHMTMFVFIYDNVCLHHDNVYLQYDNVRPIHDNVCLQYDNVYLCVCPRYLHCMEGRCGDMQHTCRISPPVRPLLHVEHRPDGVTGAGHTRGGPHSPHKHEITGLLEVPAKLEAQVHPSNLVLLFAVLVDDGVAHKVKPCHRQTLSYATDKHYHKYRKTLSTLPHLGPP
jgi:hypothetical protein